MTGLVQCVSQTNDQLVPKVAYLWELQSSEIASAVINQMRSWQKLYWQYNKVVATTYRPGCIFMIFYFSFYAMSSILFWVPSAVSAFTRMLWPSFWKDPYCRPKFIYYDIQKFQGFWEREQKPCHTVMSCVYLLSDSQHNIWYDWKQYLCHLNINQYQTQNLQLLYTRMFDEYDEVCAQKPCCIFMTHHHFLVYRSPHPKLK